MDIFNNLLFIGIAGGILSGIFVALITRVIFSRRDSREYALKLGTANREVIDAIRPGISEGVIPSLQVVESMIAATARRYGVNTKEMLTPKEMTEDLIKAVMDSEFVSVKMKSEFCEQLAKLAPNIEVTPREETKRMATMPAVVEYRERTLTFFSVMVGLMAALMTLAISLYQMRFGTGLWANFTILLPTIVATFTVIVSGYFWIFSRLMDTRRSKADTRSQEPVEEPNFG